MGATQDLKLIDETLDYIMTKVRDQDVVNVFSGLAENYKARRILVEFFKKNYDVVCALRSMSGSGVSDGLGRSSSTRGLKGIL